MEFDAGEVKKQQAQTRAPLGNQKGNRVYDNQTKARMIRQKVGKEAWEVARKKLIQEAQKRPLNYIKEPRYKKRY